MISKTAYSSQTKLIGLNLPIGEHGIGYSNLTPDPQGAWGAPGVKIQVSPNQKTSLTKVVRHDKEMIKISSAPPEELGKPTKRVSQLTIRSKQDIDTHNPECLVGGQRASWALKRSRSINGARNNTHTVVQITRLKGFNPQRGQVSLLISLKNLRKF